MILDPNGNPTGSNPTPDAGDAIIAGIQRMESLRRQPNTAENRTTLRDAMVSHLDRFTRECDLEASEGKDYVVEIAPGQEPMVISVNGISGRGHKFVQAYQRMIAMVQAQAREQAIQQIITGLMAKVRDLESQVNQILLRLGPPPT